MRDMTPYIVICLIAAMFVIGLAIASLLGGVYGS